MDDERKPSEGSGAAAGGGRPASSNRQGRLATGRRTREKPRGGGQLRLDACQRERSMPIAYRARGRGGEASSLAGAQVIKRHRGRESADVADAQVAGHVFGARKNAEVRRIHNSRRRPRTRTFETSGAKSTSEDDLSSQERPQGAERERICFGQCSCRSRYAHRDRRRVREADEGRSPKAREQRGN